MTTWRRTISVGAGMALAFVLGAAPAAWGAGHVQSVVAFDPQMAQLPESVAVADDGTIYASLSPIGQLLRIDAATGDSEIVGSVDGIQEGEFGLIGVTVGPDGAVYGAVFSANPDAAGVWRFDVDAGTSERVAGSENITLPNDVAFDAEGTLYITDTIGASIWRVIEGGEAEVWVADVLLEGDGSAGFGFPVGANGIDVHDETVYVAVTEGLQVVTIPINDDGSAGAVEPFEEYASFIDGLAVADDGAVYTGHLMSNQVTSAQPDPLAPGTNRTEIIAEEADGLDVPTGIAVRTDSRGVTTVYASNFSVGIGGPLGAGPSILAIED